MIHKRWYCGAVIMLMALWSFVCVGLVPVRTEAALWTESSGTGSREDPELGRLNQALIRLAKSLQSAVVLINLQAEQGAEDNLSEGHPSIPRGER